MKMPAASEDKEVAYVLKTCKEQGFITVKDFIRHFGITKYHARKVLDSYCEMPAGWLSADKKGDMMIYKLRNEGGKG